MTVKADIVIRAPDGSPLVAVEVTNPLNLTSEQAADLHEYLIAIGHAGSAQFFLLISQQKGFLWDHRKHGGATRLPDLEFDMEPVIRHLVPDLKTDQRLTGTALELLVIPWLFYLVEDRKPRTEDPERSLAATGILDLIGRSGVTVDAEP